MRQSTRFYVFVLAVTLLSGCAATASSRSGGDSDGSHSGGSGGGATQPTPDPGPPPPAPPAYGVSYIRNVSFLRDLGWHNRSKNRDCVVDDCGENKSDCGDCVADSTCDHRFLGCLFGSRRCDAFGETDGCVDDAACCEEGCDSASRHSWLDRFRCRPHSWSLFRRHSKEDCGEEKCCSAETACCNSDDCAEVVSKRRCLLGGHSWLYRLCSCCKDCAAEDCGEADCCQTECCNDGCVDNSCVESGCSDVRHPCLADRMEDPFLDDVPSLPAEPSQPASEVPTPVPTAPRPTEPHAWVPSPYAEISTGSQQSASKMHAPYQQQQRHIVKPQPWPRRPVAKPVRSMQPIVHRSVTTRSLKSEQTHHQITIQPRMSASVGQ